MIHLVRHAQAGSRRRWNGDDTLRPLSPRGRLQADLLARQLADRVTAAVSSPYLRCVQTLEPVAAAARLTLETAEWLGEGTPADRVLPHVLHLPPGAVICTHGDVIADLLLPLVARGVPLDGPIQWPKGSIWHLRRDEGIIVSGAYEPPAAASRSAAG